MGKEEKLSRLDRLVQSAMGAGRTLGDEADPAQTRWPKLWEWLSKIYFGSNLVKQPASLTIRLGPEGVIASLTDRDLGVTQDAACPHLEGIFEAMEKALNSASSPMRVWGKGEPKLRKRSGGS